MLIIKIVTDRRFSPSGVYYSPSDGVYDSYVEYIRDMPLIPDPEVFGLNENADITKEQQETQMVFLSFFLSSLLLQF